MGVKYVLSLEEIKNSKLKPVFTDGYVNVYENVLAMPRAFFISKTELVSSKQDAINALFDVNYQFNQRAVVENVADNSLFKSNWDTGLVDVINYSDEKVIHENK